jgi:CRISPR type III-A-associated RAMP protein Csm5
MEILNRQHYIRLTTESPLSILADSGRWLSPYADFIVSDKGDKLYYVDNQLVEKALETKPHFIEDYVNGVRNGMNGLDVNRSNFDLKDFLTKRLGLSLNEANYKVVKARGVWLGKDKKPKKNNLQTISKDGERLYLPGSSLKGAMRTALLYDWLCYNEEGKKKLEETIAILRKIAVSEDGVRYNELLELKRSAEKREERLSDREHYEFKDVQDRLRKAVDDKGIFDEEQLFGKLNPREGDVKRPPYAQHLIFRDSRPVAEKFLEATFAVRIRRIPSKSEFGNNEIPTPREAIARGAKIETSFAVRLGQIPENHYLNYWNHSTDKILKEVSDFSKQFVCYEIEKLEQGLKKEHSKKIERLLDFYTGLYERMLNGELFIRMGMGKTFYDNSLVLSLLMHPDKTVRDESAKHLRMVFSAEVKSLHPVTRTISADGYPFGWLKMESMDRFEAEQPVKKNLKLNDLLDATVLSVGNPNRVKVHIRPDFEPEMPILGYRSAFSTDKIGEIIQIKVIGLSGKGDKAVVCQIAFSKFKS